MTPHFGKFPGLARLARRVARDAAVPMADQVVVSAFNFALGIAAARILDIRDFGFFTLVVIAVMLVGSVQSHFLSVPMMTLAGARARRSRAYFATIRALGALAALAGAGFIALMVAAFLALKGGPVPAGLVAACAFAAFSLNHQRLLRRTLFGEGAPRAALAMDIGQALAMAAFVGVTLALGRQTGVAELLAMLGLSALAAAAPLTGASGVRGVRGRLVRAVLRRHWPMSRWLLLMFVVSIGQDQAIWIIAGVELGEEAIGGLRAGQYLLGVTHFIVLALENFLPRAAAERYRIGGLAALRGYLAQQTAVFGGAVLVLVLAIAVTAEDLLALVFGDRYAAFGGLTWIFALVYLVGFLRAMLVHYLRVVGGTRRAFLAGGVGSLAALAAVAPAMLWLGTEGVALTMLLGQTVCLACVGAAVAGHARSRLPGARRPVLRTGTDRPPRRGATISPAG